MRTINSRWFILMTLFLAAPLGAWERTGVLAPPEVKKEQDSIMKMLIDGNKRFLNKGTLANGKPTIMIVSCADSHVPPEVVFNVKPGLLFTTRAYGNIVDKSILASLEYGANPDPKEGLGCKVLVVLGHTNCTALERAIREHDHPRAIWRSLNEEDLDSRLQPSVNSIMDKTLLGDARLDAVVRTNVLNTIKTIREQSLVLWNLEKDDMIKIVGAVYHKDTGKVEWIKQ